MKLKIYIENELIDEKEIKDKYKIFNYKAEYALQFIKNIDYFIIDNKEYKIKNIICDFDNDICRIQLIKPTW